MLPGHRDPSSSLGALPVSIGVGKKIDTFTFVDADPLASTRKFVHTLSTAYQRYKRDTFTHDLEGPDDRQAYQALRHTFIELLEVTAATAAAAIQAPEAVHVWLIRYTNARLDACVDTLLRGEPLPSQAGDERPRGYAFTDLLDHMTEGHPELRESLEAGGHHIFQAYLDPQLKREYNSMKHSNRVGTGSFEGQTDRVDIDWDRSVVFQSLHGIDAGGQQGFVLEWGIHPVDPVSLHVRTELCLQWLEVLHWAVRRMHGIRSQELHPGYPPLEDIHRAWTEGPPLMVLTQQVTSGKRVLDDGRRGTALSLPADLPLPDGLTRRKE